MKTIIFIFAIFLSSLFVNCTKPVKCEVDNTGSVKVINQAGIPIVVDVTWGSYTYNDERTIYNGEYTMYSNVPAGTVEVWGSPDFGANWEYDYLSVSSCSTSKFTWHAKKSVLEKSSSEKIILITLDQNDNEVTVNTKEKSRK